MTRYLLFGRESQPGPLTVSTKTYSEATLGTLRGYRFGWPSVRRRARELVSLGSLPDEALSQAQGERRVRRRRRIRAWRFSSSS